MYLHSIWASVKQCLSQTNDSIPLLKYFFDAIADLTCPTATCDLTHVSQCFLEIVDEEGAEAQASARMRMSVGDDDNNGSANATSTMEAGISMAENMTDGNATHRLEATASADAPIVAACRLVVVITENHKFIMPTCDVSGDTIGYQSKLWHCQFPENWWLS